VEIRVIQLVFTVLSHNGCASFTMIGSREVTSKKAAFKELSDMAKSRSKIRRWRFGMSDLVSQPELKKVLARMEVQVTE
jgi:alkylation response protein AidB-like acyl-CoA dehydrogenase